MTVSAAKRSDSRRNWNKTAAAGMTWTGEPTDGTVFRFVTFGRVSPGGRQTARDGYRHGDVYLEE